jgi:hypothetical protein
VQGIFGCCCWCRLHSQILGLLHLLLLHPRCSHTTAADPSCRCRCHRLCRNVTPGVDSTPSRHLTSSTPGRMTNASNLLLCLLLFVVCMVKCRRHITVMLARVDHVHISHHMQPCASGMAGSCTLCSCTHACSLFCCCWRHIDASNASLLLPQAAAVVSTAAVTIYGLHRAAVGPSTEPQAVAGEGSFPRARPAACWANLE